MGRRSITDRRILITGASSGIGRALARELAPHGPHLLLAARSQGPLEELADELLKLGAASARAFVVDVTDPQSRGALVGQIGDLWGSLDLLVNNAGISAHGRFTNSTEQTLRQIMEVNFFAAAELTRLTLPFLRRGQDPMVVNVGSILGHRGIPHNSEYCASKFALRGWSEAIRPELDRDDIALLLVSPGTTETKFFEHLISQEGQLPWGKTSGISPEEVARQIVRGIEHDRREIFPNWRGRLFVILNRICPWLVDRLMQRYG
ncbi:MAG: SDR family NAD(P)-dependent oxidoreductase [Planctomycetes bacterium]|nr:SDR family NAD(P)-dependent oxidoreductase [Planctomycetota bacterium]